MSLNTDAVLDQLQSHALASGLFERVNTHEPKNAPGNGLTAALWSDRIEPYAASSGLAATSARVVFMLRIFSNMLQEPQDAIDPNIVNAVDVLMTAYSGDFDLSGDLGGANARNIDLLGASGVGLSAQAGYVEQDHVMYRVVTITIPVIINDAWSQSA